MMNLDDPTIVRLNKAVGEWRERAEKAEAQLVHLTESAGFEYRTALEEDLRKCRNDLAQAQAERDQAVADNAAMRKTLQKIEECLDNNKMFPCYLEKYIRTGARGNAGQALLIRLERLERELKDLWKIEKWLIEVGIVYPPNEEPFDGYSQAVHDARAAIDKRYPKEDEK